MNNRNTRTSHEICSKLTINTTERCQWSRSVVFVVNFEHILQLVLVFLLLTCHKQMLTGLPLIAKKRIELSRLMITPYNLLMSSFMGFNIFKYGIIQVQVPEVLLWVSWEILMTRKNLIELIKVWSTRWEPGAFFVCSYFSLREKCTNSEFCWSLFSHVWTEYGYL